MNARAKRIMQRTVVGAGATVLAASVVASGSASADSGWRQSPGGGCVAKWYSATNTFLAQDNKDNNGRDCTLAFTFKIKDGKPNGIIEQHFLGDDVSAIKAKNYDGDKWILFQVCELGGDDGEDCTKWGKYLT